MPRPRSEQARQAVLAAMRRALAADGYRAVTIEGLAAEAGIAKQTIYRWWPSKAAILGEALREGELPDVALPPITDDLRADLRAWFRAMAASLGDAGAVEVARALIAVTATDAVLGAALNERLAGPIRAWVAARLAAGVAAGEVRADVDARLVAEQFVAVASYAALQGRPIGEADADAAVDLLLRGIRTP